MEVCRCLHEQGFSAKLAAALPAVLRVVAHRQLPEILSASGGLRREDIGTATNDVAFCGGDATRHLAGWSCGETDGHFTWQRL